jgi:hypothetical protein
MCDHRWQRRGIVEKVTENGGILVEVVPRDTDDRPWWVRPLKDWDRAQEWTAYDHIYRHEPWTGLRISYGDGYELDLCVTSRVGLPTSKGEGPPRKVALSLVP